MTIFSPTIYNQSHYEAVVRLLDQLTTRSISFSEADYRALIASSNNPLFLLEDDGGVIGMLTVGVYLSPTGSKAWIEDVVVDDMFRGRGFGRKLVAHAIDYCKSQNIKVKDTTAGFKCYRREVLETLELDKIRFKGYAFQIEMKFTAYKCGFKIKEVPVIFVNRELGTSKMNSSIFGEAMFGVMRLRWDSWFRKYPKKKQEQA